ncbi:Nif3-like dinuclear metal center hexameric protein [Aerococcaceae bacterium zg-BR22]|uniref:Nif3-like dinuclear metal center hexameric protein n=1 Tax=Aerococcaceae bacterium zg-1292 TaxID=2774330 RepID=UPI004062BB26|nr:Nif3-like dinuclear metal center hexameric protein [Aerococcaceae bacterium zg-BR22]
MKIKEILNLYFFQKSEVDRIILGNEDMECTGIVVTFVATMKILEKAKKENCNLIISHEGIFYRHHPQFDSYNSKIVTNKYNWINNNNITIYRHHDAIHRQLPDLITKSFVERLNMQDKLIEQNAIYTICQVNTNSKELLADVSKCLFKNKISVYGEYCLEEIKRIAILVGYRGSSENLIPLYEEKNVDLVIFGEGPQWEIPYFIDDFNYFNKRKIQAFAVGHETSELDGMKTFSRLLSKKINNIKVIYL